ncbi:MAG TPA: FmdB family zinc ribbon protein [Thermoanaerobaculia bacterium]|jgi:putative FmdB family regulatory protein|nr:FmdB family zinc ribbon protein [Thermoanaerobaculia bacterium]
MPLYEYECTNCKERTEVLQRVSDAPSPRCPKCGAETKKLISSPAIQFKGSGFYKTDYASSSSKPETKSETKTEAKTETKTETKSESKSESKSD